MKAVIKEFAVYFISFYVSQFKKLKGIIEPICVAIVAIIMFAVFITPALTVIIFDKELSAIYQILLMSTYIVLLPLYKFILIEKQKTNVPEQTS